MNNMSKDKEITEMLMRHALEIKIGRITVDRLMEVCNATYNPLVAVAYLIDKYKEPEMKRSRPVAGLYNSDNHIVGELILVDYNKFTNSVEYSFEEEKTDSLWFEDEAHALIEDDYFLAKVTIPCSTYEIDDCPFKREYSHLVRRTGSCSLDRWNAE